MIARQPVCQWCGRREAEHVHHIDPVSECPEKALDQDNLLPLCRRCHELIETATRRGADVRRMLEARNGG
jgi:predicted HNH restriction endonuclease